MPPDLFFLLNLTYAIQALFWFYMNFRPAFCSSVKNDCSILMGITLNLYIAFGSIVIFTILSLPIHEHEICLYLFVSYMIFF